jgi:hypothetical protein
MKKQTSIAVITCWYGPYPWYLPYFMHSCSFNPTVDFYIITDNLEEIPNQPDNVKIIFRTIEQLKTVAYLKLGFEINIDYPYKLNDFKPAFGFLFPEIVQGYDFWAQSDLDVIFGNLRNFLDEEFLSNYDFISVRQDYATGCFALYRNNEKMNTYFMKSIHYQQIFSSPKHYCFDECSFAYEALKTGKSILEIPTETVSFTHLMKAGQLTNDIRTHFDFILLEGLPGQIIFNNGTLVYKQEFEIILYHLIHVKTQFSLKTVPNEIPNTYSISTTQFLLS